MQTRAHALTFGLAACMALAAPASVLAADVDRAAAQPPKAIAGPAAYSGGTSAAAARSVDRIKAYWTTERMEAAVALKVKKAPQKAKSAAVREAAPTGPAAKIEGSLPATGAAKASSAKAIARAASATGAPWYGSAYAMPATTTGKLFFRNLKDPNNPNDDRDGWCSASVVNTEAKNLIFTAGHCVHGGQGGTWHANSVFVPGYRNGARPYGTFVLRQPWAFNAWTNSSDHRWDVAAATMHLDGYGRRIANVVGSQGIAWNQAAEQFTYNFGYPANKNGGELMNYCSGNTSKEGWWIFWTGRIGMGCDMTFGTSGGPWLMSFNGSVGYLHSVSSTTTGQGQLHGPYFDTTVANLYNSLRHAY